MDIRKIVIGTCALLCALIPAAAQNADSAAVLPQVRTADSVAARQPAKHPVQSITAMPKTNSVAVDTMVTSSPGVVIVLYADNTWSYYRDPEYILQNDLFTECWNEDVPNPFQVSLTDLPEKISLVLLDSLDQYCCPNQVKVFSRFGPRHRRNHMGVDLPLHTGDPVYAAFAGKVRISKVLGGYGNLIVIRHENGLETFYGHLSKRLVEPGDWVEAGQVIGDGGSTGRSSGPHLHFETRYRGYAFDPQWLIDFESGVLRSNLFILKRKYLSANSLYVPQSDDEEEEINEGERIEQEEAAKKAAEAKAAAERAAKAAAAAKYHTIRQGDTLSGIAKRYGTTVNSICRLNSNLSAKTTLSIGRKIRVK